METSTGCRPSTSTWCSSSSPASSPSTTPPRRPRPRTTSRSRFDKRASASKNPGPPPALRGKAPRVPPGRRYPVLVKAIPPEISQRLRDLVKISPTSVELSRRFERAGHQLYLVGGSVRDALLDRL